MRCTSIDIKAKRKNNFAFIEFEKFSNIFMLIKNNSKFIIHFAII